MSRLPTLSATEIPSERLLLRKAHDADREGLNKLLTDPEVRTYLGGPRPGSDVEQGLDAVGTVNATSRPGSYIIADNTTFWAHDARPEGAVAALSAFRV